MTVIWDKICFNRSFPCLHGPRDRRRGQYPEEVFGQETVIVKIADKLAMAVLPADFRVNFDLLKDVTGADKIELASELGFKDSFPDCDVGAMPPFGNLYRLEVYAAESLAKNEEIMFNAGTHSEIIKLAYKDFENLAKPKVANFSYSVSL